MIVCYKPQSQSAHHICSILGLKVWSCGQRVFRRNSIYCQCLASPHSSGVWLKRRSQLCRLSSVALVSNLRKSPSVCVQKSQIVTLYKVGRKYRCVKSLEMRLSLLGPAYLRVISSPLGGKSDLTQSLRLLRTPPPQEAEHPDHPSHSAQTAYLQFLGHMPTFWSQSRQGQAQVVLDTSYTGCFQMLAEGP